MVRITNGIESVYLQYVIVNGEECLRWFFTGLGSTVVVVCLT